MHPDLLNNSLFLRYYDQWQQNPSSVVFAPIAEYFLHYGLLEDAIKVCQEGLKHHPDMVSGRLSLAKAYLRQKEFPKAQRELRRVLELVPNQEKALELMGQIQNREAPAQPSPQSPPKSQAASWQTVTMAKIFAAQGHIDQAREVFQFILKKDPQNEEALRGLQNLEREG
ncbi:MAG: tetratricopeptide repeat protein [Deltaproteobacteria bacterium]|nr:tetratricopeptide repeat protein [Deltaproteobacteria bacterium]